MNIIDKSDIKFGNSRVYLNNPDAGTNLFYTNNFDEQYYILMREEVVIASGVLKGYGESGNYQYRFDFQNFIKIYNQDIQPHTIIDEFGSYKFEGDNSCNLYLYLSNIERLESNIFNEVLIKDENGEIRLNRENYTYNDIVCNEKVFVSFIDAKITDRDQQGFELQYRTETQEMVQRGSYTPITVYRNNLMQYNFIDSKGDTIFASEMLKKGIEYEMPGLNDGYILTESDGYVMSEVDNWISLEEGMFTNKSAKIGYVTYMLKIPENASKLVYFVYTRGGETSGTYNNLIANSELIKFYSYSSSTTDESIKRYDGCYLANPVSGRNAHIYGGYATTVIGEEYSSSLWVKLTADSQVEIYRMDDRENSTKIYFVKKDTWQYISSKPIASIGKKYFSVRVLEPDVSIYYKKAKTELGEATEWRTTPLYLTAHSSVKNAFDGCMTPYYFWGDNGAYDTIYCNGVANKVVDVNKTYVNFNGKQMPIKIDYQESIKHNTGLTLKQEQIYSLIKSPQVNKITIKDGEPHNDIYNIELESFEGYNGVNLSDRNLELIFTKPKKSNRITNKNLTFFD